MALAVRGDRPGERIHRLCRERRGARRWWLVRSCWSHYTGPAPGQVQPRWKRQYHPWTQHGVSSTGLLHPRLRLVWFQPWQYTGRGRQWQPAHRHHRREHHALGRVGFCCGYGLHLGLRSEKARYRYDGQRAAGRPGGDHCSKRLRESTLCLYHRRDCRCQRGLLRRYH